MADLPDPPIEARAETRTNIARIFLLALLTIGIMFPVLTVRRVPVPFADAQLYASIALSRHLYGIGVPTISWNSPAAVDHIAFYGPVFFDLCALFERLFGVTLLSFRMVSLLGTALYVWGTVLLTRQFTTERNRPLLAATLAVLAPEVSAGAGAGAMHMLALGFEVLALAAFVRAFDRRRSGRGYAALAGVMLVCAALTTTRSYPFVFAFVVAAAVPGVFGSARLAMRHRLTAVLVVLTVGMGLFAISSHGSIPAWIRYLAYIFTHEDTDVAILPTAVRDFDFHPSALITPCAAIVGGLLAAHMLRRRDAGRGEGAHAALSFLLLCSWIELVTTATVLNYTFTIGEYIALPLFSVIAAWPGLPVRRGVATGAVVLLLAIDTADLAFRATAVAATWAARDPDPVNAFIAAYVPARSAVIGAEAPFLFPVERNFSRYRTVSPRSWADWARWVPIVEPKATLAARAIPVEEPVARFFIWQNDSPLPDGYACAAPHAVAAFEPAPIASWTPRWMRTLLGPEPGYPAATLYRLPDDCPTGYDPTRPPL